MAARERDRRRRRIGTFDAFVFAGGLVNLAVVLLLFGYWLING